MGRFARSWDLFKTSLKVVKQDKELLWMPVLGGLASLVAIAGITGVGFASGVWPETQAPDGGANVPGILLAFALYIVLAFIALFFNAAVVAGASERLAGGDPTVGSALRAAARKAGKLFLWSIVVATVNVLLQMVRERNGAVGQVLAGLAGTAWNLATYFMVPILVFESQGLGGSLRRSGGLFKQTWGETVIGQGGLGLAGLAIGIVAALVGVVALMLLAPLGVAGLVLGVAILALAVVGTALLMSVLEGVYKAALYRYAMTHQVAPGFEEGQLAHAWRVG